MLTTYSLFLACFSVDEIIIVEKLEIEEDFYKIKFILKTGELINKNLLNGKLDIGNSFGKYGFTITKQGLGEQEDNVSAYVLQWHSYIYCKSHK